MADKPVKERILDAAMALLGRDGGKKLAQVPVAKEAGVPQGHLTYYFPRRSDLLGAVARRFVEEMATQQMAMLAEQRDMIDLATSVVTRREQARMLIALFVESEGEPALREQLQENASRLRTGTGFLLGTGPDDPDAVLLQATLWGLSLQHLLYTERTEAESRAYVERLAEWIAKIKPAAKPRTKKKARR